jgi:hypothetical protein
LLQDEFTTAVSKTSVTAGIPVKREAKIDEQQFGCIKVFSGWHEGFEGNKLYRHKHRFLVKQAG